MKIGSNRVLPNRIPYIVSSTMLGMTLGLGAFLSSSYVSADDNTSVVDQINITVPVSCTVSGTGMNTHNAEIANGVYTPNIGTTTLHAFCNDNEGFSIYAAGYTGNEIGGESSNKLVGTSASSNATIDSGLATSSSNPDVSNWAMKLAISQDSGDTTGTNAFTIDSAPNVANPSQAEPSTPSASFSNYHIVPNEYTKVAYKDSATDMDTTTGGVKLTTTYAAYISKTQAADTYSGQVIYTLVHPSSIAPVTSEQIGVNYHANGSTFANGETINQVIYQSSPMYIATTPLIVKSDNILDDGTQNGAYTTTDGSALILPISATGASKMKVVIDYGLSSGSELAVIPGDGSSIPTNFEYILAIDDVSGSKTFTFDGDTITVAYLFEDDPVADYDYGFYAQVYPIYATEEAGTEPSTEFGTVSPIQGTYTETTNWNGSWYADINNQHYDFTDESEVTAFISDNLTTLGGANIDLYRGLTYEEAYTRANKSQDGGYYKQQELTKSMCNTVAVTQNQTVKDMRDNKTYVIGKMKDSKCWMLQNLDLDLDSNRTYTNLDTDLGYNTSTGQYETASWTPARSTYETSPNNTHEWCQGGDWNSEYNYCEGNNTPESYDPGDLYWNGEIGERSDWRAYENSCDFSTNPPTCDESLNPLDTYTTISGTPTPQYHFGNYYNWPAAIATNDASIYGVYNEDTGEYENTVANQSICPTGWTLPGINFDSVALMDGGELIDLWKAYGVQMFDPPARLIDQSTLIGDPLYSALAGRFDEGLLERVGNDGMFWSSRATDEYDTYSGYFGIYQGLSFVATDKEERSAGTSVRCVLR